MPRKLVSIEGVTRPAGADGYLLQWIVVIRLTDGARDSFYIIPEEDYIAIMEGVKKWEK